MVKIKQVGIGRMASGTIDGITYVTRGDVTFARSTPTMPAHVYTTPAAKKRRAIFNMIQMHLKHHSIICLHFARRSHPWESEVPIPVIIRLMPSRLPESPGDVGGGNGGWERGYPESPKSPFRISGL